VSATEVAVSVTVAGDGTAAGALYVVGEPLKVLVGETLPHVEVHGEGGVPCVRVQVTPALLGSKLTVAVNGCVVSSATVAGFGVTETAMALRVIVTVFDFVESLAEVAWMITGTSLAGVAAGAVYVTVVLVRLLRVPTAGAGEVMAQDAGMTPAFAGSKLTVAVIVEVPAGQG
jgi:hypothetical protein